MTSSLNYSTNEIAEYFGKSKQKQTFTGGVQHKEEESLPKNIFDLICEDYSVCQSKASVSRKLEI